MITSTGIAGVPAISAMTVPAVTAAVPTATAPVVAKALWQACGMKYRAARVPPARAGATSTGLGMTSALTSPKPIFSPASRRHLQTMHEVAIGSKLTWALIAGHGEIGSFDDHDRHRGIDQGHLYGTHHINGVSWSETVCR